MNILGRPERCLFDDGEKEKKEKKDKKEKGGGSVDG